MHSDKSTTEQMMIDPNREAIGKKLIVFAWAVEILAVAIGLAIALMQGLSSFTELNANFGGDLGLAQYTNITIAMLPFIMVAAVEATKIPFTEAAYKTTKLRWRIVFGFGLVFLTFVTFESALNGFERNFQALIFSIDKDKKALVSVEEQIEPLAEQRTILSELSTEKIESEYNTRHSLISQQRAEQSEVIQSRIDTLRAATQSAYIKTLKDQIADRRQQLSVVRKDKQSELGRLQSDLDARSSNTANELSAQRRSLQKQLSDEKTRLDELRTRGQKEIDDAGFFSENSTRERVQNAINAQSAKVESIRQNLNALSDSDRQDNLLSAYRSNQNQINAQYQSQIDRLNKEIKDLSLTLSKSLGALDKDVERAVNVHLKELGQIEKQFQAQQAENKKTRDNALDKLANNESLIEKLDQELFALKQERVELRNKINLKVGDNQVYRMAQWWYGKESAADLDRKNVMFIATLWFGSLALLIAITGVLLALASYVIRDPKLEDQTHKESKRKFYNSARRWLIYMRRQQRAPKIKTVVKEVPVEKVVMVDKPIEIIKKEIVHVPLYTDDRSLLNARQQSEQEQKQGNNDE